MGRRQDLLRSGGPPPRGYVWIAAGVFLDVAAGFHAGDLAGVE
ncbi:hypothetical protein [Pyrobaculum ferrireducens]|uniref:Uncharacterized protein n=1 Tax=Pyrobaculum ferrireducens TaxID=1104324 RepID=G7VH73_9CREN|nr:hypothetical protein [Pyrobaculum ferrireducens]AET31976.1 hypothetical protein P186_0524 [Pyrobaculum ferrireducens]